MVSAQYRLRRPELHDRRSGRAGDARSEEVRPIRREILNEPDVTAENRHANRPSALPSRNEVLNRCHHAPGGRAEHLCQTEDLTMQPPFIGAPATPVSDDFGVYLTDRVRRSPADGPWVSHNA